VLKKKQGGKQFVSDLALWHTISSGYIENLTNLLFDKSLIQGIMIANEEESVVSPQV